MIDALLYSVRDAIRGAGFGYGTAQCDIRDDGQPPPAMGDIFVAVHQGASRSTMKNALNEYFGFNVTLTMRATVPYDRIGDQMLARKLAKEVGFNRRAEQLRAFLHQNWGILQDANQYLIDMETNANVVYGFCEAAQYAGMEIPALVGAAWFLAESDERTGLKAELRFEDARRLQPIASYT